jgi:hypothetical protein
MAGFAMVMGQAVLVSVLTSRVGLGFGNWMRTVQR